jgi:hypothetical protein
MACKGSGRPTLIEGEDYDPADHEPTSPGSRSYYVRRADGKTWNTCPSCEAVVTIDDDDVASVHEFGVDMVGAPAMARGYVR